MLILHLGNQLPDARVEKTMLSDLKRGDQVVIAVLSNNGFSFKELEHIPVEIFSFGFSAQLEIKNERTVSQIQKVIDKYSPNLIHAHDIYNGILATYYDLPIIYNDHEGWSEKIKITTPSGHKLQLSYWRRLIGLRARKRWINKSEPKLMKGKITITVSDELKKLHEGHGATCFAIHNFPLERESKIPEIKDKIPNSLAYVGKDLSVVNSPFRDTTGFLEVIKKTEYKLGVIGDKNLQNSDQITNFGYVPHNEINTLLLPYQYGVLAFNPNAFHKYADHVKIYHYLYAGCQIIAPSSFNLEHIPFVSYFDDFEEIPLIIEKGTDHSAEEIHNFSVENFTWEKEENKLSEAVKLAISKKR